MRSTISSWSCCQTSSRRAVGWELSVKPIDDHRCEFTNRVRSRATEELRSLLDKQGIPFDVFRAQRQPMSTAHNRGETPFFAASIERFAMRD